MRLSAVHDRVRLDLPVSGVYITALRLGGPQSLLSLVISDKRNIKTRWQLISKPWLIFWGVFAIKSPNVGETCRLLIAGHGRRSLNSAALQPGRRSRSLFFSLRQSFNLTRLCTFMASIGREDRAKWFVYSSLGCSSNRFCNICRYAGAAAAPESRTGFIITACLGERACL